MSRELPSSPFQAPASPEKAQKKPKQKRKMPTLVKALGLAAGLHAAAYSVPDVAERIGEYQEAERVEANRERIEHDRAAAVARALEEIRTGNLHFWEFIRDTDRADMEAAGLEVPDETEVETGFNEVARRLQSEQQGDHEIRDSEDMAHLRASLRAAFKGYYYTAGTGESDIQTYFQEHGGPCGMISLAVASTLDHAGFEGVGLRFYPPNETGWSHVAPSLAYVDDDGVVHEIDLVGGGDVVPGGVTLPLEKVVSEYAIQHGLLAREGATPTKMVGFGSASRDVLSSANVGPPRGWGLSVPMPADARPFTGNPPYYSADIFGADPADETRNEEGALSWPGDYPFRDSVESFIPRVFDRRITTVSNQNEVDIDVRVALTESELGELSNTIGWAERKLLEASEPDDRLYRLTTLIGLYRLASDEASLGRRAQIRDFTQERIRRYTGEAEEILVPHIADGVFLDRYLAGWMSRDSKTSSLGLALLHENGGHALINLYDYYTMRSGDEFFGLKSNVLVAALLNGTSHDGALERANQLTTQNQFIAASDLRRFYFNGRSSFRNEGPIMDGSDMFSRNCQAYRALFDNTDFVARVMGGRFFRKEEEVLYASPTDRFQELPGQQFRNLNEMRAYVERYATAHDFDQEWVDAATKEAISEVHLLVNMTRNNNAVRAEALLLEGASWLQTHGHPRYADLIRREIQRLHQRATQGSTSR